MVPSHLTCLLFRNHCWKPCEQVGTGTDETGLPRRYGVTISGSGMDIFGSLPRDENGILVKASPNRKSFVTSWLVRTG